MQEVSEVPINAPAKKNQLNYKYIVLVNLKLQISTCVLYKLHPFKVVGLLLQLRVALVPN